MMSDTRMYGISENVWDAIKAVIHFKQEVEEITLYGSRVYPGMTDAMINRMIEVIKEKNE